MKAAISFAVMLVLGLIGAAYAQAVPEEALQADYKNCMGEDTPDTNAQRAEYCQCVMDEVKKWDAATYSNVAGDQSKAGNQAAAPQIDSIAKACISRILK